MPQSPFGEFSYLFLLLCRLYDSFETQAFYGGRHIVRGTDYGEQIMQQLSLPDVFVSRLLFSPDKFGRTVGLLEFDVGFQRFQMDRQTSGYSQQLVAGYLFFLFVR